MTTHHDGSDGHRASLFYARSRLYARPVGFPRVPPKWTTSSSEEHWVTSRETRDEIAALLKAAVKQPAAKRRATWAKAAKLLPKQLREIVGDNSPGWGAVASREVADVAMALIVHADERGADLARVQRELERILPDLPMVSLNGMVEGKRYRDAVAAIERSDSEDRHALLEYLSSS